jgi:cytidine deaminase
MIEEKQALIDLANVARQRAYVPYSNYPVGAALRTRSGRVYTGVNVENAAYPQTMCAERVAIFKAVSEGETEFEVISVVTDNGGSPCGGCRQVMAEFGLDTVVLMADGSGRLVRETTVRELLPDAFTPDRLSTKEDK